MKYFTSVRSVGIILWWWWFEGDHMKFSQTERGTKNFSAASRGGSKI